MARILIIDDDARLSAWVRTVLEEAGHRVREARNGSEGIAALGERPADLLLCDLFMPGKDGLETIRDLRRDFPRLKVIAMSGGGFNGTVDMLPVARALGAATTLPKPFSIQSLLAAVEEVLHDLTAARAD